MISTTYALISPFVTLHDLLWIVCELGRTNSQKYWELVCEYKFAVLWWMQRIMWLWAYLLDTFVINS